MNLAKPIVNGMAVCAAALLVGLAVPAHAKSVHSGISARISVPYHGGHHRHHAGKRRGHGHHHRHRHRARHHGHRFQHRRAQSHHKHRGHRRGHLYFRSARGCHPVKKYFYDHHGRASKVVGTMCYDLYGNGYIVPGSRRGHAH